MNGMLTLLPEKYLVDICLEDLCLATRPDHPTMACVDEFMVCVRDRMNTKGSDAPDDDKAYGYPKNEAKARAHAFLASMPESDKAVGIAAEEGYWKMDHPVLKALRAVGICMGDP